MGEKTFREGNIHDDVYWSPKQKEGSMDRIEQIKQWHEYHGSCVDALLKGAITLEEFNLHEDEFDRFFDSLYSSQEPQKVVCPDCDGKGNHLLASMGTAKVCSKCNGTGKVSQSVSTPTEGMELSEEEIRQVSIPESYDREMMIARQIAKFLCTDLDSEDYFADAQTKHTYWVAADSILKLMLARADKALLTNWECYSKYFLDAKLEYMERVFAKQGNRNDIGGHTEEAAVSAGCTAVAKAQLQAIKSILEGK